MTAPEPTVASIADLIRGIEAEDWPAFEQASAMMMRSLGLRASDTFTQLAAGRSLAEALGLPPAALALLYRRGYTWLAVERFDRAEPVFRALCHLAPEKVDYWLGLAIALGASERRAAVEAAFERALTLRPTWGAAHYHRARYLCRIGAWAEAGEAVAALDGADCSDLPPTAARDIHRLRVAIEAHAPAERRSSRVS